MSKKLEDFTAQSFWDFYYSLCPAPPGTPKEEIEGAKNLYMSGVSAMLVFAQRVDSEAPERRKAIHEKLYKEMIELSAPGMPDVKNLN